MPDPLFLGTQTIKPDLDPGLIQRISERFQRLGYQKFQFSIRALRDFHISVLTTSCNAKIIDVKGYLHLRRINLVASLLWNVRHSGWRRFLFYAWTSSVVRWLSTPTSLTLQAAMFPSNTGGTPIMLYEILSIDRNRKKRLSWKRFAVLAYLEQVGRGVVVVANKNKNWEKFPERPYMLDGIGFKNWALECYTPCSDWKTILPRINCNEMLH